MRLRWHFCLESLMASHAPPQTARIRILFRLLCQGSTLIFDSAYGLVGSEILSNIRGFFHLPTSILQDDGCRYTDSAGLTPAAGRLYIKRVPTVLPILIIPPCISRPTLIQSPNPITLPPLPPLRMAGSSNAPVDRECRLTSPCRHTLNYLPSRLAYATQQLPPSQRRNRTPPIHGRCQWPRPPAHLVLYCIQYV